MSFGGETVANQLLTALLAGDNITIPQEDLTADIYKIPGGIESEQYQPVRKLTNEDLTSREVGGTGTFDALMAGFSAHLKIEYEKNRITGAEYTKAFIALTEGAMANAVQYLLGRDAAFWQAVTAQAQAITARVNLETAKIQYAALYLEALNGRANYALTKLKLSTEDVTYAQGKYTLDTILPLQRTELELRNTGQTAQNNIANYNLTKILPEQYRLTMEQYESQRAQTQELRSDGLPVLGSIGKQKELYTQQITSYRKDAELKAAKVFSDIWTVIKTIDEGLEPPPAFTNTSIEAVMNTIKASNNLGI